MTLKDRVARLEAQAVENEPPKPGLVYLSAFESEDEARVRFERERGYPFPSNGTVVRIDTIDSSK